MDYLLQARAERARQPGNAHAAVEGRGSLPHRCVSLATLCVAKLISKIMAEAPRYIKKLGSIPRTPTLRVLAAQQDLAFCFVYVKCWGTNAMFLLRDLLRVLRFSSASQFYHPRVEHRERHKMVVTRSTLIFSISRSHLVKNASRVYISCAALAPRLLSISDKRSI
jgi:hypothetical protein